MAEWFYIGPDRAGLSCPNCCDAFVSGFSSPCVVAPCGSLGLASSVRFRSYYCAPPSQPSPCHVYSWDHSPATNVVIEPNPVISATSACYVISPSESESLNSAGRIGSGCTGQTYVSSESVCNDSYSYPCPSCSEGCTQVGYSFQKRNCSNCSSCVDTYSYTIACSCSCPAPPCCDDWPDCTDPPGCSCCNPWPYCLPCPDGTGQYCQYEDGSCTCTGGGPEDACTEAACCLNCTAEQLTTCQATCTDPCSHCSCDGTSYTCVANTCSALGLGSACPPGYSCVCGDCRCQDKSTCCEAHPGWKFNTSDSSNKFCYPCNRTSESGLPLWPSSKSDCCDADWKRKYCSAGQVCCNDGNCYPENTVLCTYASDAYSVS
jgi:hypothetical protein